MRPPPDTGLTDQQPPAPVEPAPAPAPVLDYRAEAPPSRFTRPMGPGEGGITLGVIAALICALFSGGNVPITFIAAFAAAFAFMVFVATRAITEWAVSRRVYLQLFAAAALFVVAGVVICARAGDGAGPGWTGSPFSWPNNPGYRHNRDFALRPWPAVVAAVLWFAAVVAVARRRQAKSRDRSLASPAPPAAPSLLAGSRDER